MPSRRASRSSAPGSRSARTRCFSLRFSLPSSSSSSRWARRRARLLPPVLGGGEVEQQDHDRGCRAGPGARAGPSGCSCGRRGVHPGHLRRVSRGLLYIRFGMAYSLENALFQWREGERRVADSPSPCAPIWSAPPTPSWTSCASGSARASCSTSSPTCTARAPTGRPSWPIDAARAPTPAIVVDAAFARYAREASNFAGGRAREQHERP